MVTSIFGLSDEAQLLQLQPSLLQQVVHLDFELFDSRRQLDNIVLIKISFTKRKQKYDRSC